MSPSKFSSDHETFVQIFHLSCSLENKIYMRVCRKNIRVQCGIIFYHVLFTSVKLAPYSTTHSPLRSKTHSKNANG